MARIGWNGQHSFQSTGNIKAQETPSLTKSVRYSWGGVMKKKLVFCKNCRYVFDSVGLGIRCKNPKFLTRGGYDWYSDFPSYGEPSKLNKENNCSGYKKQKSLESLMMWL